MSYSDLLRDPRWQRKRLEVFTRAGWECDICGDSAKPLHVHHVRYHRGRMPWEYEDAELRCLCETCHARQHPEAQHGLVPIAAIVSTVLRRLHIDPELCVVCQASFRTDLARCASCRYVDPLPSQAYCRGCGRIVERMDGPAEVEECTSCALPVRAGAVA